MESSCDEREKYRKIILKKIELFDRLNDAIKKKSGGAIVLNDEMMSMIIETIDTLDLAVVSKVLKISKVLKNAD